MLHILITLYFDFRGELSIFGGGFGTSNLDGMALGFNFLQPSSRWSSHWLGSKCTSIHNNYYKIRKDVRISYISSFFVLTSHILELDVGFHLSRRQFCSHCLDRFSSFGKLNRRKPCFVLLLQFGALHVGILV
jgi:hypothetical protein